MWGALHMSFDTWNTYKNYEWPDKYKYTPGDALDFATEYQNIMLKLEGRR
jgi:hypothetical protein